LTPPADQLDLIEIPADIRQDKMAQMIEKMKEETDEWMEPSRK
jgi:hypothetical protein